MFAQRAADKLEIASIGLSADLGRKEDRAAARDRLHTQLLESTYVNRRDLLIEVERQLRPEGRAPRLTMNWDDVRELSTRFPLFEIGGHSHDHIDFRACPGHLVSEEVERCGHDLRRELGRDPQHFSFSLRTLDRRGQGHRAPGRVALCGG